MTTRQENHYKWLFLLLSDVDEVKDEHFEERFIMEYECGDNETGDLPKELIDYQETNTRLRSDLEIYFDEDEDDKRRLLKVATGMEEIKEIQKKEREELEALIHSVKNMHQKMIETMREKVSYIREVKKGGYGRNNLRMSDDDIKKLVSVEKKRLIQFREDEDGVHVRGQPEQKKRKSINDHKSRCSDQKVQFFQKTKEKLDREENEGLIASWERVYKLIMNKHVKEKAVVVEPILKEPSKMLNELSKAVDLEELMNAEQNLNRSWLTV